MATTTPNYGWSVPTSTDLVKDGATAIELLGDSIDTSFVDLLGGTTGQVLTKASNTSLDFTFATPASGGKVLQVLSTTKTNTFSTTSTTPAAVTGLDVIITPTSATSKILVFCFMTICSDPSLGFPVFYLQRGATEILKGDAGAANQRRVTGGAATLNSNYLGNANVTFLDSPSSTSALTYGMYVSTADSSGTVAINRTFVNGNNNFNALGTSTITVMEIGA